MSELDEWRKRNRDNAISDPDEVLAMMKKSIDLNAPKYRLEFLFDEKTNTILLQGNQAGLESILGVLQNLVEADTVSGTHYHFDRQTGLSKNDLDLIIQRVNDDDDGAHTIE